MEHLHEALACDSLVIHVPAQATWRAKHTVLCDGSQINKSVRFDLCTADPWVSMDYIQEVCEM